MLASVVRLQASHLFIITLFINYRNIIKYASDQLGKKSAFPEFLWYIDMLLRFLFFPLLFLTDICRNWLYDVGFELLKIGLVSILSGGCECIFEER